MTVRLYKSTDASAPTLNGTAGSLTTVLDAILVNGYGAVSAAGWTIAYTGTNQRVYTMAAGGTGFSLFVNDTGPGAGTGKEARICGFEAPTGLGTGTGQFPTGAQSTIGTGQLVVRKSTTADSTARAWTCIADGNTLYFFAETGDYLSNPFCAHAWMFGDFFSYKTSDAYSCMIIGRAIENTAVVCAGSIYSPDATTFYDGFSFFAVMDTTGLSNTVNGHYVARSYNGVGSSIAVGKHSDLTKMGGSSSWNRMMMGYQGRWSTGSTNTGTSWTTQFVYPSPVDGGLYVAPTWIHHNGYVRGYMKGIWCPLQHLPAGHNDTYSGTGNMSGKSFIAQNTLGLANVVSSTVTPTAAQVHIEYSDTWS